MSREVWESEDTNTRLVDPKFHLTEKLKMSRSKKAKYLNEALWLKTDFF
jgi:hypothetical protein